ncbi:MAG TPA: mannosyltransferase family protein, partial [Ktedonobacteraceae bacterium]|nr:mannosyltransferase family protein [Ktedonobacteraceae bacterium]
LMKRAPTWDIVWLFIATRVLLMLVTYIGYILLTEDKYSHMPVDINTFFILWERWDAVRYVAIARHGYQTAADFAFFPLYPLLIATIAYPLGDWSTFLVGVIISNAALLGALFILYQIAADSGGEQLARRTLLYLCIFPTAFFFFTAYNESLLLLFTAGTFLALRRQHWWLAGLLGFLAALTRSAGVFLVVPYLYELWVARESVIASLRNTLLGILPVVLIPLGTALYCFYCWKVTGNPLVFATVQDQWSRHLSWPWQGIWQALFEFFWNQPFGSFNQVHVLLDLSATLGFIALAVVGRNRLRTSYTLWIGLLLLYYLLSPSVEQHDPLISNQRFVLEMFPGFITLAMLGIQHPRLHQALLWIFPALLATLTLLFIMNSWMV